MGSRKKTTTQKQTKVASKPRTTRSKSKRGRKRANPKSKRRTLPVKSILIVLSLLTMMIVTVGAVGYVIFFRTVLAHDDQFIIKDERNELVTRTSNHSFKEYFLS